MKRLVILDFDGTVTDAEQEGQPFVAGYLEDLAALTGREVATIREMAARFEAEVLAAPHDYGWIHAGAIVAPASVDPYVRIMPVATKVLDACGAFREPDERHRLLDAVLFRYNYRKTVCCFRPHAKEALEALSPHEAWVVTNAHVEPVLAKIDRLGPELAWLRDRVVGRAMKHQVDERDEAVPAVLSLPGLSRPVLLRRRLYRELLERLRNGRPWDQVTVVGDIFELDLSLPLVLGARVVLAANRFTPPWERAFVSTHERGTVIEDLGALPGVVGR